MTLRSLRTDAQSVAENLGLDMRQILRERREALDSLEKYVDSWDQSVADPDLDPRAMTEAYVVQRAMEQVEAATVVHSGGTGGMHLRQFRTRCLQLATAGGAE